MILVDGIFDRAIPDCSAPNLARASVPLNHEEVTLTQSVSFEFAFEQLDCVDLLKVKPPRRHVGHT